MMDRDFDDEFELDAHTSDGLPRANDDESEDMDSFDVTGKELLQIIERFEALDEQKAAIARDMKEVMAEAKGRGYDAKALRAIISERKRDPDEIAELSAIIQIYRNALGMSVE